MKTRTPAKPGYKTRNWAITDHGRTLLEGQPREFAEYEYPVVNTGFRPRPDRKTRMEERPSRSIRVTEAGRKMLEESS